MQFSPFMQLHSQLNQNNLYAQKLACKKALIALMAYICLLAIFLHLSTFSAFTNIYIYIYLYIYIYKQKSKFNPGKNDAEIKKNKKIKIKNLFNTANYEYSRSNREKLLSPF